MHLPAGLIFSVVTPAFIIGPLPHITEAIFSEANIKVANTDKNDRKICEVLSDQKISI